MMPPILKQLLLIAALASCFLPGAQAQLATGQRQFLSGVARREHVGAWPEMSDAQARTLEANAEACLANYQQYHQPFGLTADILFSDRNRSKVERLDGIGDAATWTGHYLAALAFRYHVTSDAKTLNDINLVLDTFDQLTRVSGKKGFIVRFAGKIGDPAYARYYSVYGRGADPDRPGFGSWAFQGVGAYSNLVWLGYPSRDVYVGVNLGLSAAYRLVSDTRIRVRVTSLVESIIDCLIKDSWAIVDNEGHEWRGRLTPSMKAALLRTAVTVRPAKYQPLYDEAATTVLAGPAPELCKYCTYFSNNLEVGTYYVLATLENDPGKQKNYLDKLAKMWRQAEDHLNGWFAAAYLSATGNVSDPIARAVVQGTLIDFPPGPRWDAFRDHSLRADLQFIESDQRKWAKFALPVSERIPADFLWQRSPFDLKGGADQPLEYPALDFLLPYWAARQCGVIPAPPAR